jgi:hypothetical protein
MSIPIGAQKLVEIGITVDVAWKQVPAIQIHAVTCVSVVTLAHNYVWRGTKNQFRCCGGDEVTEDLLTPRFPATPTWNSDRVAQVYTILLTSI